MSSTCARCGAGLTDGSWKQCADQDDQFSEAGFYQDCLERQLSNQAALLRSVTISLEQAAGYCESGHAADAAKVLDGVLERLS